MTNEEFQKIVADALKPIGDRLNTLETRIPAPLTTAAAKGTETGDIAKLIGDAVGTAIKPFADKLDNAEKATAKAQARAAVEPHIKRGAIPPQDNEAIAGWEATWIANAKFAEAAMAKLPSAKAGGRITASTRVEDGGAQNSNPVDQVIALAEQAMVKNPKLSRADALIAAAKSQDGEEQYQEFRAGFAHGAPKRN